MENSSGLVRGTAAFALLLVSAVWFVSGGSPVRPVYVFVVFGGVMTLLLAVTILQNTITRETIAVVGVSGFMIGLWYRVSTFDVVISSGIDHYRWVTRVQKMLSTNGVTGSDMYASAPFYLLELAVGQELVGLEPFQTRFVTILVASTTPLVAYLLAYRVTEDRRVALIALLVAVPQMLFLRTSALLEAESLAIPWALLSVYLLLRYLQTDDTRTFWLFMGFTVSSVFLHFLYALVIFGIAAGVQVTLFLLSRGGHDGGLLTRAKVRRLAPGNAVVGVFLPLYILSSTFRGAVVDAIRSVFTDPAGDPADQTPTPTETPTSTPTPTPTETPGVGTPGSESPTPGSESPMPGSGTTTPVGPPGGSNDGGGILSVFEPILDVVAGLLPSTGTVGSSTGLAGSTGTFDVIGTLGPVALFATLAGIGGLVTLARRSDTDLFLLAGAVSITGAAVAAITLDLLFNLGFRLYYFLGSLLVVFAAIGIERLSRLDGSNVRVVSVVVLVVFLGYAAVGAASPVGNNVDPRFGGEQWYITESERDAGQSLQETFSDGGVVGSEIEQWPNQIQIRTQDSDDTRLLRSNCRREVQFGDTGLLRLCRG